MYPIIPPIAGLYYWGATVEGKEHHFKDKQEAKEILKDIVDKELS